MRPRVLAMRFSLGQINQRSHRHAAACAGHVHIELSSAESQVYPYAYQGRTVVREPVRAGLLGPLAGCAFSNVVAK